MSVVTVLGAPGRTGRHLVRLLTRRGFTVRAGVRDLHRRGAVAHLGVPATIVDLAMSQDELAEKFTGSDVVINCAGAADPHPDAVNLVDRDGAIKAIRAAGNDLLAVTPKGYEAISLCPAIAGLQGVTFTRPTYAPNPSTVGEQMTGAELGEDSWTIPPGGMVHKVVPIEQTDHG